MIWESENVYETVAKALADAEAAIGSWADEQGLRVGVGQVGVRLTAIGADQAILRDFNVSTRFWWSLWRRLLPRIRLAAQFDR
jgi:hypothetical protein